MNILTAAERAAGFTTTGDAVILAPGDAVMTRQDLAAWFAMRGVLYADIRDYVNAFHGKTRAEMEKVYEDLHGDMA